MKSGPFEAIDFDTHSRTIVALSGGGDSTALLVMLSEWRAALAKGPDILAVTVDHGLRPESRAEAEAAGALCASLGIEHRIANWSGPKPETGMQEAAREARYELLSRAARDFGAGVVLTGHTRDDQRETVLMRRARGEGQGLAGIAPATLAWDARDGGPPVWFARPLLNETRTALRQMLVQSGVSWTDDPSNENADFERVRARRTLAGMPPGAIAEIDSAQEQAARERISLGTRAAAFADAHMREVSPGLFRIEAGCLETADAGAALHALRLLLAFAGGAGTLHDAARSRALFQFLASGGSGRRTLARCVIDKRKTGIFVLRERRGMETGTGQVFDGRYRLQGRAGRPASGQFRLVAEGEAVEDAAGADASVSPALALAALARQPVLDHDGLIRRVWRPEPGAGVERVPNPWPLYLPSFDLAAARALARLGGLPDMPDLPFR